MKKQVLDRSSGGCFPNPHQILLLQAALLSGEAALSAWKEWSNLVDINNLELGEVRLLPLLYHNLKQQGISETELPKILKERYYRTWSENKILFDQASKLLYQFELAKIPTMVLKGSALATQYYPNCGLRPMSDIDLLVPTDRAQESIALVQKHDWSLKLAIGEDAAKTKNFQQDYTYITHGRSFTNSQQQEVDLHWHFLRNSLALNADQDFWESASSIEISGVKTLMLDPVSQLLHVCSHGASWNSLTPIRWVADAMMIIQKYPNLDWSKLVEQTVKHRLTLQIRTTLQFLITDLAAPIPIEVLQELNQIEPTVQEKLYFQSTTLLPTQRSLKLKISFVIAQWQNYCRNRAGLAPNTSISLATQIYNSLNFFQVYLNVDSKWQIPVKIISKISQHWEMGD